MGQINIMHDIYNGAYATLVSLNGQSANDGLPRVSKTAAVVPQAVVDCGRGNFLVSKLPSLEKQIHFSTWVRRGWTFQEGILSPRRLFFTSHQVYFSCNNMLCSESLIAFNELYYAQRRVRPHMEAMVNPLAHVSRAGGLTNAAKLDLFESILGQYVVRQLSYERDILNAISGLLSTLQEIYFPEGFFYGIPRGGFKHSLLWIQEEKQAARLRLEGFNFERREYFPSWTWAGWKWSIPVSWKFQDWRGLDQDVISNQVPQPPLRFFTKMGESINPDETTSSAENLYMNAKVPHSLLADLETVFEDLVLFKTEEAINESFPYNQHGALTVEGVLIDLEIIFQKIPQKPLGEYAHDGIMRDDFNRQFELSPNWKIKMNSPNLRLQFRIDESIQRLLSEDEPVKLSYLLIRIIVPEDFNEYWEVVGATGKEHSFDVIMDFLLLRWEDGVALRAGVFTMVMQNSEVTQIKNCNMRLEKFILS